MTNSTDNPCSSTHHKRFCILDVMGFLFRSYHAIRGMTTKQGLSTNALFGFARALEKIEKDFSPQYLVAVFDGKDNDRSRKALYDAYKAHRSPTPQDLLEQFPLSQKLCDLLGIPTLSIEGVEADDTIATLSLHAAQQGFEVLVFSTDKDLTQIVSPHISLINNFKQNSRTTPDSVLEKYGVSPERMVDWLALVGDTADNVPGVRGIGPKSATDLLQAHGSLETLLSQAHNVPGAKGKTLLEQAEMARLSKQLVTLDQEVSISKNLEEYTRKFLDTHGLQEFFLQLEFHSLLRDSHFFSSAPFVTDSAPKPQGVRHLIETSTQLDAAKESLAVCPYLCLDTETTDTNPQRAQLVGIGVSGNGSESFYFPCNGSLTIEQIRQAIAPLCASKPLIGHNFKYDMHVLNRHGWTTPHVFFDTMIASYVLQAHERQHGLDALALKEFGIKKTPIKDLIGSGKKQITMDQVPLEQVAAYCLEDVECTWQLFRRYQTQLHERGLIKLFEEVEMPLIQVLYAMEQTGIYVDPMELATMTQQVQEILEKTQETIYSLSPSRFNINSPKQLQAVLFQDLGIKAPKKTATGFSTSHDVLITLAKDHPICQHLIDYRTLEKLRSTYLEALPKEIDPQTHRIHPTFNQSVAATGRLSCQNPNLQNIPIRTELGRSIRHAFRPQTSQTLFLSADYAQIELRLLAHFSQDPHLLHAFTHNLDVHQQTAARIFGVPPEQVTPHMRYRAKTVNFGILYGQQAYGLSQELQISQKEAKAFIASYFDNFTRVESFLEHCKEQARKEGVTKTLLGRERLLPDILSKNIPLRLAAERLSINTPLQGSQADLIKLAMIQLAHVLEQHVPEAKILLQIHDELLLEVPESQVELCAKHLQETMENVYPLTIPLIVDVHVGKNWQEC